jgi:hypothetical protein
VYDFIKILIRYFNDEKLIHNPVLNFQSSHYVATGEIPKSEFGTSKIYAEYHNLIFTIIENHNGIKTLLITGSLHKFYNKGKHNFDDFNIFNIRNTIDLLGEMFHFNIETAIVQNLEIAINVLPPIPSLPILKGLLSLQNIRIKSFLDDDADLYQAVFQNYINKNYDKAKHYRKKGYSIPYEIFRSELKYIRMNDLVVLLKRKNIIYRNQIFLSDLKRIEVIKAFGELLQKKWNEILFYDHTISTEKLSESDIRKLDVWQNINQWEKFDAPKKYKQKKILAEITENHSRQIQLQISKLIESKINDLILVDITQNHNLIIEKDHNLTRSYNRLNNVKESQFNHIAKDVNYDSINIKRLKKLVELERVLLIYADLLKEQIQ